MPISAFTAGILYNGRVITLGPGASSPRLTPMGAALSGVALALFVAATPCRAKPAPSTRRSSDAPVALVVRVEGAWALESVFSRPEIVASAPIRASRGLHRLELASGAIADRVAHHVAATPGVTFCHPDRALPVRPQFLDDPLLDLMWHLENTGQSGGFAGSDVGAFDAWTTTRGEGEMIAVLDTGVDLDHPDLSIVPGYDFVNDDDDPSPNLATLDYGHGTAMAGLAAATGDNDLGVAGVAPGADILPVKVVGGSLTYSQLYAAMTYAVDRGAGVLMNAWGYAETDCAPFALPDILRDALDYAETEGRGGRGAIVVFSAGNGGCDIDGNELLSDERVVVVGAVDDRGERPSYSSFGASLDVMAPSAGDGRPGLWTTDITGVLGYDNASDGDYWSGANGTSAAAAVASGVFALMLAADPNLMAADARAIACDTAQRDASVVWDAVGRNPSYGCGRIDASAAVDAVVAARRASAGGCSIRGGRSRPTVAWAWLLLLGIRALRRRERR